MQVDASLQNQNLYTYRFMIGSQMVHKSARKFMQLQVAESSTFHAYTVSYRFV